jgi:hypothetical protein
MDGSQCAGGGECRLDERDWVENVTILSGDLGIAGASADNAFHVVTCAHTSTFGEFRTILDGFTIIGGNTEGGSRLKGAGLWGGLGASPQVRNCRFLGNHTDGIGGGVYLLNSHAKFVNCEFSGNSAAVEGGGVYIGGGEPTFVNCTFSWNDAESGTAAYLSNSAASFVNSVLWGRESGDALIAVGGSPMITYCDVRGNPFIDGEGNVEDDPQFRDPDGVDDMLGTLDDDVRLSSGSLAINAGDPSSFHSPLARDLERNPRVRGCRVDMGAYETEFGLQFGDFDGNGNVDLLDLAGFQLCMGASIARPDWVTTCVCLFDANESGGVDLFDFADFHALMNEP